jgi:phosphoglycolate phosphatase
MYNFILFDLDGTLTDPKIGITKSVQYALQKFDIEEPDLNNLTKFIGPPIFASFKNFYHFNDTDAWKAVGYYRERFAEKGLFENTLLDGIHDLIKTLFAQGKVLYVATSKPTVFSKKIIQFFNLTEYFADVVGPDLQDKEASKTRVIERILEANSQKEKKDFVMIGDREHDIIGAKNCGIDSIGVLFGYGSKEEIEHVHPTHIVSSVQDLQILLTRQI